MSYITITASAERAAMQQLYDLTRRDIEMSDDELRAELHALIRTATETHDVLVRG